ncbi:MAG: RNA polymerase sigma factor, partial [Terriglobales bacterium]
MSGVLPELAAADDPDLALVLRVQQGDAAAFEELYYRHQAGVSRMVANFVRYPEVVPDLVQEIFAKVYLRFDSYSPRLPFRPWLYRVASNHCLDFLRHRRRQPLQVSTTMEDDPTREWTLPDPAGERMQARLVARDLAGKLLLELSPRDRMLLVLKEINELSLEEIGAITGLRLSAVKVGLFRARKRMLEKYRKSERELE